MVERISPDAEIVAWQLTDLAELGITEEQAADALQWVEVDGTVRSGHEAIAAMLSSAGRIWKIIGRAVLLPGSLDGGKAYRLVARTGTDCPEALLHARLPMEIVTVRRRSPSTGAAF